MKLSHVASFLALSAVAISGCASGPKFRETKDQMPELKAGLGRVYFYRTTGMGAALSPDIRLNGEVVGSSRARAVFFVDRAPGHYKVETSTEVTNEVEFDLKAHEEKYVRFGVSLGLLVGHVYPEMAAAAEGAEDIGDLAYTGPLITRTLAGQSEPDGNHGNPMSVAPDPHGRR